MRRVLELLETREAVHVAELADAFAVSAVTVRTISPSWPAGLVARVRGGVRALQRGSRSSASTSACARGAGEAGIARAAAAMVGEGEAVALDSSTTAYYLALELR